MVQFKYSRCCSKGKQSYAKVDVNLPRRVILVGDVIVQETGLQIVLYRGYERFRCNGTEIRVITYVSGLR